MSRHHRETLSASKPRLRLAGVAVAVLALVAAACGEESSSASTIDTIDVSAPADGATVGESFDVDVDTSAPIGEPDTGRQHLHFYYDVEPGAEDYDIVYEVPFTTRELAPGEHTIHAVVANGDHSITDVRQTFTVTVDPGGGTSTGEGGGDGEGGGADETPAPLPPGY
jgi:hypothetical protein